ncbi:peptidyl-prolyl cis-trans isomerase, rhodopsin-specific isozyme-like [Ctenocephalides felis]|uniref:peptidyl-prolyl cis-trans isomerase, rhodopsin-specific isozyme-like n=1 Tax=Ctenocephalides felis TaxID=7515 RepID=UPI000E6E4086|nr:peptidyl-prolyl cis-trans isomerase, rhodopsin-specific isozyme-like [Ctenocephalides felis]
MLNINICTGDEFTITDTVFLDITSDKMDYGTVVIGLFGDKVPKTVKNFKTIITKGIDGKTYVGTQIFRVVKKFIIQGGDLVYNNGSGSVSIYGKYFKDESFNISHKEPGLVGMANKGKNTNGCQFYITTAPAPWLDGNHVIFGKVLKGQRVIHAIERAPTNNLDTPIFNITIKNVGVLDLKKPYSFSSEHYDLWDWLSASAVPLTLSFSILGIFQCMISKLHC